MNIGEPTDYDIDLEPDQYQLIPPTEKEAELLQIQPENTPKPTNNSIASISQPQLVPGSNDTYVGPDPTTQEANETDQRIKRERSLMKDLNADVVTAADNFRNIQDEKAAKYKYKAEIKQNPNFISEETARIQEDLEAKRKRAAEAYNKTLVGRAHQEALDINNKLGEKNRIRNLAEQREAYDEAESRRRQAQITATLRRTLMAGLAVLGIGLGAATVARSGITKDIRSGVERIVPYFNPENEYPQIQQKTIQQSLGIPNNWVVEDMPGNPEWYVAPEIVLGETDADTRWNIITNDPDPLKKAILTEAIKENGASEDYFLFKKDGQNYALRIRYGNNPQNPNQGEMSIVKISEKAEK